MNTPSELDKIWQTGTEILVGLESEDGILASGKEELYGCLFGRDSLITSLFLLNIVEKTKKAGNHSLSPHEFLPVVKKTLATLAALQGREVNIESGEEPGKIIHEYRRDNHEHLTKNLEQPWYVYPDGTMRIYDSVDATALFLITVYEYARVSGDEQFIHQHQFNIEKALDWILKYGDKNGDGLIDYQLPKARKHGGLAVQSWMDSVESLFHEDGSEVVYPVAPAEAQSYVYLALRLWGKPEKAAALKEIFNYKFVAKDEVGIFIASVVDGSGRPHQSVRSIMGHCLWASLQGESIIEDKYIGGIVARLMSEELFDPKAGIRTLSMKSRCYDPFSYHNGSIWPHDVAICADGMEKAGFTDEASQTRGALLSGLRSLQEQGVPAYAIELFSSVDGKVCDWQAPWGQVSNKQQAWAAAGILSTVFARHFS